MKSIKSILLKTPIDKILHFIVGFCISASVFIFSLEFGIPNELNFLISIGVATLAGALNETSDYLDYGRWDLKDFLVTVLGALFLAIPVYSSSLLVRFFYFIVGGN